MKNSRLFLVATLCMLFAGCYNDFDTPAPAKVWTDEELEALELRQISIKEVKDKFISVFGSLENTGSNKSWSDTKTLKLGAPSSTIEAGFANLQFWEEAAGYYIKGKVISSDAQGNVYKSLYIDDGTAAIELKLCGTLFTTYKLDLGSYDSSWVYVKLKDLYLGNYRMMLSLGDGPSNALNTGLSNKYYANSNFESIELWHNLGNPEFNRVLPGAPCRLVEASIDDVVVDTTPSEEKPNIIVVNSSNYAKLSANNTAAGTHYYDHFGRLIRFQGVTIRYANVTYRDEQRDANGNIVRDAEGNIVWGDEIKAPAFGTNGDPFPNWVVTDSGSPVFSAWYYWAYSRENVSLYGAVLMLLNENATGSDDAGAYSIRTSGYSRFAMRRVPRNGTVGNVLGIYSIYSQRLNDYAQYQITVNRIEDLDFPEDSLVSQEWIDRNTPEGSYNPPVKDGSGEYDD